MTPDIFVIVTAYDEAERIGATLAALAAAFPGAHRVSSPTTAPAMRRRRSRAPRALAWCAASV